MAGNAQVDDVVINFTTQTKGVKAALQRVARNIKKVGDASKKVTRDVDSLNDFITGLSGRLQSYYSVAQIAVGALQKAVGGLASEFVNVADQQDRFVNKLNALTDGKGVETFERLNDWALEMPVNTAEAINAFTTMKAYGLDPTLEQMESLVDVSAVFGEEAIPSVARALGQMASLGKVSAEEINQLAEVGINARKILSDAFGMTVEEIQKSNIAIDEVIQAIWNGLKRDFGGAAKGAMDQWGSLIAVGVSYWKEFVRLVANTGLWDMIKERFRSFIDSISEFVSGGGAAKYARAIGGELMRIVDIINITIAGITGKDGIAGALDLVLVGVKALAAPVAAVGRFFLRWKVIWAALKVAWGEVTTFIADKLSSVAGFFSDLSESVGLEGTSEKFDKVSESLSKWAEEQEKINPSRMAEYDHAIEQIVALENKMTETIDTRGKLVKAQEEERQVAEELAKALEKQEAAQQKLNQTQSGDQYIKNAEAAKQAQAEVVDLQEKHNKALAEVKKSRGVQGVGEDLVKEAATFKAALNIEEEAYKNLVAVQQDKAATDEQLATAQLKFQKAQEQTVALREKQFAQQVKESEAAKKEAQAKAKAAEATRKQAETSGKAATKQSEFGNAAIQAADSVDNLSKVLGGQTGVAQQLSGVIESLVVKYRDLATAAKEAAANGISGGGGDSATVSVQGKARGGILSMAEGGALPGSSPTPTSDNLLFAGTAGEYVHPVSSVKYYGEQFMDAVRKKLIPRPKGYAFGGLMRAQRGTGKEVMWSALQGDLRKNWGGWGAMQDFGRVDINMGGQEIPVWTTSDYSELLKQAVKDGQSRGNKWFGMLPDAAG